MDTCPKLTWLYRMQRPFMLVVLSPFFKPSIFHHILALRHD